MVIPAFRSNLFLTSKVFKTFEVKKRISTPIRAMRQTIWLFVNVCDKQNKILKFKKTLILTSLNTIKKHHFNFNLIPKLKTEKFKVYNFNEL